MMGKNLRINKSITLSQTQAAWCFCPVVASCSYYSFQSRLGDLCRLSPFCKSEQDWGGFVWCLFKGKTSSLMTYLERKYFHLNKVLWIIKDIAVGLLKTLGVCFIYNIASGLLLHPVGLTSFSTRAGSCIAELSFPWILQGCHMTNLNCDPFVSYQDSSALCAMWPAVFPTHEFVPSHLTNWKFQMMTFHSV